MASDEERELLAEKVLKPVAERASRLRDRKLTGFLAMSGNAYDRGLMIVGRATNGWIEPGVTPRELGDPNIRGDHVREVQQESLTEDGSCPMLWVTRLWPKKRYEKRYCTGSSAFWRSVCGAVKNLGIANVENVDWPSHLVWSNLYKLAPVKGGNPSEGLCRIQLSGCIELLGLELRIYRPSRVLFLTGEDWAQPFLSAAKLRKGPGTHVRQLGHLGDAHCVVAVHPQGKPETHWVDEVVAAFGRLQ